MLILDKSRALDLMVAHASRERVPEEFTLDAPTAAGDRAPARGFRVAVYGPMPQQAPPRRPEWTWQSVGAAS